MIMMKNKLYNYNHMYNKWRKPVGTRKGSRVAPREGRENETGVGSFQVPLPLRMRKRRAGVA